MKMYRTIRLLLLLGATMFAGSLFAQGPAKQPVATKLIEQVAGVWKVTQVNDGKKDIAQSADATAIQSIEFTREAKYIIRNKTTQLDSGLYRLNEQQKVLYLESGKGTDVPPVEWGIDLKGNNLILSGKSTEQNPMKYTFTRASYAAGKEKRSTNPPKGKE